MTALPTVSSEAATCHLADDRETWNTIVAGHRYGHVLQSFEWGQFKSSYGWQPVRLLFQRESRPVAAASMLVRRLPLGVFSIAYVPKGPVVDYADRELAASVLSWTVAEAGRRGALFVKIDPDILAGDQEAREALAAAGFQPSHEQIQRPNTVLLDLRPSEEELLAAMKQKTRYNIRVSERKGVVVTAEGPESFEEFYQVYRETGERDAFIVRPYDYCRHAWQLFLERGYAAFFAARYEGQMLGGVIPFAFGTTAWYMYGASSSAHRNLMANNLLQWHVILWAKQRGCTVYDMWGAPDLLREGEPLWGPYQFKLGFGADLVCHAGAYDRVLRPGLNWLWDRALPAYQDLLRRLHGEPPPPPGGVAP